MTALRLPAGAPVRSKPPWNRQRPLGWLEVMVQGVPDMRRAPQMRRPYKVSLASTVAIQSSVHELARGVPRGVVRVVSSGFLRCGMCPYRYTVGVAVGLGIGWIGYG